MKHIARTNKRAASSIERRGISWAASIFHVAECPKRVLWDLGPSLSLLSSAMPRDLSSIRYVCSEYLTLHAASCSALARLEGNRLPRRRARLRKTPFDERRRCFLPGERVAFSCRRRVLTVQSSLKPRLSRHVNSLSVGGNR